MPRRDVGFIRSVRIDPAADASVRFATSLARVVELELHPSVTFLVGANGSGKSTLIEAIAYVLERDYGFIHVSDDRLEAAVNVSTEESENFLAEILPEYRDDDDDDDDDDEEATGDYRTILADFDPDPGSRLN